MKETEREIIKTKILLEGKCDYTNGKQAENKKTKKNKEAKQKEEN